MTHTPVVMVIVENQLRRPRIEYINLPRFEMATRTLVSPIKPHEPAFGARDFGPLSMAVELSNMDRISTWWQEVYP